MFTRLVYLVAIIAHTSLQAVESKKLLRGGKATQKPVWIFCAAQWNECICQGQVRWGSNQTWKYINPKKGKDTVSVRCDIKRLPDLLPGDGSKHCQCLATPGTAFYRSINPGLMPPDAPQEAKSRMVTSCEKFEAGAGQGRGGALLWEAVEPFCSKSWRAADTEKAGTDAMDFATMSSLMRAWVDPRFADNYDRIFNKSGWAPRAFVNYYAGAPGGTHARLTEELVRSVHLFSKEPIVVVHYGFFTPSTWNAKMFPRLVLLNAAPIPSAAGRSFHFNKFRAMLLSRVLVGVELDSDQFVAPGIDVMFKRTAEEVTEDYPMPILPSHFWSYGPNDVNLGGPALWKRYCPSGKNGNCKWQTQRWGHAHPTWTYWALPFVGRWLRRNFRDESLPAKHNNSMKQLRVTEVTQDEDLFNVGTWEEGGTKQWCKFDMPDPTEFDTYLAAHRGDAACKTGMCGDIGSDVQFAKHGVAKAFYTAHHAVEPDVNRKYIKKLQDRQAKNDLAGPVLYHGKFYKSGVELKQAHPDVGCLI